MQVRNSFDVPLAVDEAWGLLLDIPRIAPCMPGAKLTAVDPDGSYQGEVAVRLGPMQLNFRGRARIVEEDRDARRGTVRGEGTDTKGRGRASADIAFSFAPSAAGTRVEVTTDVSLTGSIAQYGRASGMLNDLATHLVGQFSANLRAMLARDAPPQPLPVAAADAPPSVSVRPPSHTPTQLEPAPAAAAPIAGGRLGLWLLWRALLRMLGIGRHTA